MNHLLVDSLDDIIWHENMNRSLVDSVGDIIRHDDISRHGQIMKEYFPAMTLENIYSDGRYCNASFVAVYKRI